MANRIKQIKAIQTKAETFGQEILDVSAEIQESLDNLPENLQESELAERLAEYVDTLDLWADQLNDMAEEEL